MRRREGRIAPVTNLTKGMLVENTVRPQWGPGKIVQVDDHLHIIFRDLEQEMAKKYPLDSSVLRLALAQSDPILDNLPPLREKSGYWALPAKRLSLEALKRKFQHEFPAGCSDPKYFASERDDKLRAHLEFQTSLGLQQAANLLANGEYRSLATKALKVLSEIHIPMLAVFETAAFHDAMQNDDAVRAFFTTLIRVLDTKPLTAGVFDDYAEAVASLPADRGKVATWPVATVFLYLAEPERHMFLKPEVTKAAADSLGFDLRYNATPNWTTYEALLRMGSVYLELLRPLGARDFLDVQSFIYVTCGGYDNARAKAKAKKQSLTVEHP